MAPSSLLVARSSWLVVVVLLLACSVASAQNYRMMKDSATHGDSIAYGESMTGFFAVGQATSAPVSGASQQGWIGFLPVIRSLKPLSVFENPENDRLKLAPNPASDRISIDGILGTVSEVQVWSVIGSPIQIPFQQTDEQVNIDIGSIPSGSYRIVLVSETGRYSKAVVITH